MTLIFTEASLSDITKHVYFTVSVIICYSPKVRNLPCKEASVLNSKTVRWDVPYALKMNPEGKFTG